MPGPPTLVTLRTAVRCVGTEELRADLSAWGTGGKLRFKRATRLERNPRTLPNSGASAGTLPGVGGAHEYHGLRFLFAVDSTERGRALGTRAGLLPQEDLAP